MIQRVEDLTAPPTVGEIYRVRCADLSIGLVPIMGPLHNDAQFIGGAASADHHHHDPRFTEFGLAWRICLSSAVRRTPEERRKAALTRELTERRTQR